MSDIKVGYMCGVAFEHELGEDSSGTKVFPSIESLKENNPCWEECGIVQVSISKLDTTN